MQKAIGLRRQIPSSQNLKASFSTSLFVFDYAGQDARQASGVEVKKRGDNNGTVGKYQEGME
jgi:hypothetical protein